MLQCRWEPLATNGSGCGAAGRVCSTAAQPWIRSERTASRRSAEQLARSQTTEGLQALLAEGERIPLRLAEVEEVRGRLRRVDAWLAGTREAMLKASCELRELQDLQREAEALRIKVPEADALRERTAACKKWMTTVNNELLRRTSSRKASGARLTLAVVEGLLGEAATLRLDAVEITQVHGELP